MLLSVSFIVISMLIISALMVVFKMISYSLSFSQQKSSTFECGFDTLTSLRLPFSLNFFIVSVIFLIFDVELILLLPFIFMMKMEQTKSIYLILMSFFFILLLGFIYEWWMGLLNWLM